MITAKDAAALADEKQDVIIQKKRNEVGRWMRHIKLEDKIRMQANNGYYSYNCEIMSCPDTSMFISILTNLGYQYCLNDTYPTDITIAWGRV